MRQLRVENLLDARLEPRHGLVDERVGKRADARVAMCVGKNAVAHVIRQERKPVAIITAVEQSGLEEQKLLNGKVALDVDRLRARCRRRSRLHLRDILHQLAVIMRSQCRMNSNWITSARTGRNARPGPS